MFPTNKDTGSETPLGLGLVAVLVTSSMPQEVKVWLPTQLASRRPRLPPFPSPPPDSHSSSPPVTVRVWFASQTYKSPTTQPVVLLLQVDPVLIWLSRTVTAPHKSSQDPQVDVYYTMFCYWVGLGYDFDSPKMQVKFPNFHSDLGGLQCPPPDGHRKSDKCREHNDPCSRCSQYSSVVNQTCNVHETCALA